MIAHVFSSCGRCHLSILGIVVATQGEPCRDPDVPLLLEGRREAPVTNNWSTRRLKWVAARTNLAAWAFLSIAVPAAFVAGVIISSAWSHP